MVMQSPYRDPVVSDHQCDRHELPRLVAMKIQAEIGMEMEVEEDEGGAQPAVRRGFRMTLLVDRTLIRGDLRVHPQGSDPRAKGLHWDRYFGGHGRVSSQIGRKLVKGLE